MSWSQSLIKLATYEVELLQKRLTEIALRRAAAEARFRALANHAPVGIFLTDTQGDALFVNETWRTLARLEAMTRRRLLPLMERYGLDTTPDEAERRVGRERAGDVEPFLACAVGAAQALALGRMIMQAKLSATRSIQPHLLGRPVVLPNS